MNFFVLFYKLVATLPTNSNYKSRLKHLFGRKQNLFQEIWWSFINTSLDLQ